MSDTYIAWPEYHQKIEYLAARVYQSGWQFNQVVCIAKGGLRVGDLLSRIFNQPLAILAASSYLGSNNQQRGPLKFANTLTMTTKSLGNQILLVDDLVDSGITLEQTVRWLQTYSEGSIQELKTAVIWYKACSVITPDYYVDYLADNPWIHQPFERYEKMAPDQLAEIDLSGLAVPDSISQV